MDPQIKKIKKKKYPKLPNGFGQIKVYGGNRRRPVAVFPPATQRDKRGLYVQPKPLAWCSDYMEAFGVLDQYNRERGWYNNAIPSEIDLLRKEISQLRFSLGVPDQDNKHWNDTFAQVYEAFYDDKYNTGKAYSTASKSCTHAAFKRCATLHDRIFRELDQDDLQKVIDDSSLKYASLEHMVSLYHQMYKFAGRYNILVQDYSKYVVIKKEDDDEHGRPFTEDEIKLLWQHAENETVQLILIMIYSGFRISAYTSLAVHIDERYFQGGVKTKTSKMRIVPIHSAILPFVTDRYEKYGCITQSANKTRKDFRNTLSALGILGTPAHTPHDCRHTFSFLCEKYNVKENDRKRMLGHAFQDITNKVYGHRDLEELRAEIEKIQVPK